VQSSSTLILIIIMSDPTRESLQNEIVNKINSACRYILSLPNFKSIEKPERPIQILTLADPCGYLPIHFAIASHNEYLFNLLIEIFSSFPAPLLYFNSPDTVGNTPLHWAIMMMNYQAAVVLVQCGADISRMNSNGRSPLHLVVSACMNGSSQSDLSAHRRMAKFLITVGAQVDCHDINNVTPLHIASEIGDSALVESLIQEGGAFVNVTDDVGETPLFYALRGHHSDVVKKLVDFKANLFTKNDEGESPLEFCLSNRDTLMVDLLNQFTEISTYCLNSPNSGMNISGISLSGMSISDSNSLSRSNEASSMDIDLSKSQELVNPDLGANTNNLKRLNLY